MLLFISCKLSLSTKIWRLKNVTIFLNLFLVIRIRVEPWTIRVYKKLLMNTHLMCMLTVVIKFIDRKRPIEYSHSRVIALVRIIIIITGVTTAKCPFSSIWRLSTIWTSCRKVHRILEIPNPIHLILHFFLIFLSKRRKEWCASWKFCTLRILHRVLLYKDIFDFFINEWIITS